MKTTQEYLAEAFREQANWRRQKAAEYPDDRRNGWAATSIDALARYVLTVPADDPRIKQLGIFTYAHQLDGASLGQATSAAVGRFGFDAPVPSAEDADQFLDWLVELASEDHHAMLVETGEYGQRPTLVAQFETELAQGEREGPF